MASSSQSLLPAAALLLLLSAAATAANARLNVIGHVSVDPCMRASFQDVCEDVLKAGGAKTEMDLEIAAIKATIKKVKEGIDTANKAIKDPAEGDKVHKSHLEQCKQKYNSAIEDLNQALQVLTGTGSDADLNLYLSAALTSIDSCSTEWGRAGINRDFPLGPVSQVMIKLASNTLSLGNSLKDPKPKDNPDSD